jgi:hypothetical protein
MNAIYECQSKANEMDQQRDKLLTIGKEKELFDLNVAKSGFRDSEGIGKNQ